MVSPTNKQSGNYPAANDAISIEDPILERTKRVALSQMHAATTLQHTSDDSLKWQHAITPTPPFIETIRQLIRETLPHTPSFPLPISSDDKETLLTLLHHTDSLSESEQLQLLQALAKSCACRHLLFELSQEEWKQTPCAKNFYWLAFYTQPDTNPLRDLNELPPPPPDDPETPERILPFSHHSLLLSAKYISSLLDVKEPYVDTNNSDLSPSHKSDEPQELHTAAQSHIFHLRIYYETRERPAIEMLHDMIGQSETLLMSQQTPSANTLYTVLLDHVKKHLPTHDTDAIKILWNLWQQSTNLLLPATHNVFASVANTLLLEKMKEWDITHPQQTDEFITLFVPPILSEVSPIGQLYGSYTECQQNHYEAINKAIHQQLPKLLDYYERHPQDQHIQQLLASLASVKLPSEATAADFKRLIRFCPLLTSLDLSECKRMPDTAFQDNAPPPYLKKINASDCDQFGNQFLSWILNARHLEELDIAGCSTLTDTNFQDKEPPPYLKKINASGCDQFGNQFLSWILNARHLEELDIAGCSTLTDANFQDKEPPLYLKKINASGCDQFGNQFLSWILKARHLEELDIAGCSTLTDTDFQDKQPPLYLKKINASGCDQFGNQFLSWILNVRHLEELDITGCLTLTDADFKGKESPASVQKITACRLNALGGEFLSWVLSARQLQELDITGSSTLTDADFKDKESPPYLKKICASSHKLGGEFLSWVLSASQLQELDITGCSNLADGNFQNKPPLLQLKKITACGVNHLGGEFLSWISKAEALEELDISFCLDLTEQHFEGTTPPPSLQKMKASGLEKLADQFLCWISKAKALQELRISYCGNLADSAFKEKEPPAYLTIIDVSSCRQLKDEFLFWISKAKALQELRISFCANLADVTFTDTQPPPFLQKITAYGVAQLADKFLSWTKTVKHKHTVEIIR